MDEPRDDVDIWLSERVKPLLPHPGTFERVRKRARRRKLGQAGIAAGGAAMIVAAAVSLPHFVLSPLHPAGSSTYTSTHHATPPQPTHPATSAPSLSTSAPSPNPSPAGPPPVPADFTPTSVTFVSTTDGWVIGQAGAAGHCGLPNPGICTSLAGTSNGGQSWYDVRAPVAGPPAGGHGVSQVRSLNGVDGWAFGPQLYATHDGGQTWARVGTGGMRVTDLETVHGRAFAVWAHCTGTGPRFAGNCTRFSLYSTPAGADNWAPVAGVTNLTSRRAPGAGIGPSSAQLALANSRGYLLAPNGDLYSGPTGSAAGWQPVTANGNPVQGCGLPGPAQANGVPSDSLLATTGTGLVEMCPGHPQGKILEYSPDGGRTWQPAGAAPRAGTAASLAGTPAGQVVVATNIGIDVSTTAPGVHPQILHWRTVTGASLPGGFSFVGMTTSAQGVAIPADPRWHAVWFTYDGGKHWHPSYLR